ncbi:autotransporter assembly complex family protein [Undibacterium sp.]|uniref:autotransporter assembly complex protein TamA n=1 Tax=Undibacterium sp. TaxID=1914977 RepID=UPI0025E81DE0|nr:BamA/TamA family outer membrane protein [Undibacterium sp.]
MTYLRSFAYTAALLLLVPSSQVWSMPFTLAVAPPESSGADNVPPILNAEKADETASLTPTADEADPDLEQDQILSANSKLTRFRIGQADDEWQGLLVEHIPELSKSADALTLTPGVLKRIRNAISSILATEGYFSVVVKFEKERDDAKLILVNIDAGQRTTVQSFNIQFSGALGDAVNAGLAKEVARRDSLIKKWLLPQGAAFRDAEWGRAKIKLLDNLRDESYAGAKIEDSSAVIDAEKYTAVLDVAVASGPPFILGEMTVNGLQRYPSWLLDRYSPPKAGEPYSRERLLEFQRVLQNSPYFSTVAVSVDPDTSNPAAVPLDVSVIERRARDVALGLGYSTNTGFRSELTYRDRHLFDRAWDLRSALRIEQRRQLAYADIYLPPTASNQLDSFGVLNDHTALNGLDTTRTAMGIKRTTTKNKLEQRLGLNLTFETSQLDGELAEKNRALVASIGWTWRDVDNNFAPRKGQIALFDLAVSEKAVFSDQRFIRAYGKYQRWIPVGARDGIILRAELGQVFSEGSDGIPEDYLFRSGGSTTVRGYPYQSLGIQHETGVTGGRVMSVASAEYVHWIDASWGSAVFMDVGDAADTWRDFSGKQAYGVGARYMTPAGPIALDLAYAAKKKKFAIDFSIAIAF